MRIQSLLKQFTAPKVTVGLLCLLSLLLLLNVILPQETVLGEKSFQRTVENSPVSRFFLVVLGLGRMSTSPLFLGALALFFLNLTLVLASRIGPTFRRISLKSRSEKGLEAWARMEETFAGTLPEGWGADRIVYTLRGFGYQVRRAGEVTFWGVKHRTAPLGFLLFHLSFFLLCAGGLLIYYTRFVGVAVLTEGQHFDGVYSEVLRKPPFGDGPELSFSLIKVLPLFEGGTPVQLGAEFSFRQAGSSVLQDAEVNHPAQWGAASILIERAGLAPVLWLQDSQGFSLDEVAVPARTMGSSQPTEIVLAESQEQSRVKVLIHPLEPGTEFPQRSELGGAAMRFQILQQDQLVFDDLLSPGQAVDLPEGRLVLREFRYWAGLRIIAERGGGLLIVGFIAGILGLIWRLLGYRREVVVNWDEAAFRIVGRAEYFSWKFQEELKAIFSALQEKSEMRGGREATTREATE